MSISLDELKGPSGHLFYGYGGSGKTTLCRAATEAFGWERTLWLNTDRPIQTFDYPRYEEERYGVADVLGMDIETLLRDIVRPVYDAARKGEWMYDLVVFDGLTETEAVTFAGHDASGARDKRQVWGALAGDMQQLFWHIQCGSRTPLTRKKGPLAYPPLGAVVLATAGVRERPVAEDPTDDRGNPQTELTPGVRGQFGTRLDHYFNQVLYVRRTENARRLYLKPRGRIHVKNDWEDQLVGGAFIQELADIRKENPFEQLLAKHKRFK